jgi:hypothetical protein
MPVTCQERAVIRAQTMPLKRNAGTMTWGRSGNSQLRFWDFNMVYPGRVGGVKVLSADKWRQEKWAARMWPEAVMALRVTGVKVSGAGLDGAGFAGVRRIQPEQLGQEVRLTVAFDPEAESDGKVEASLLYPTASGEPPFRFAVGLADVNAGQVSFNFGLQTYGEHTLHVIYKGDSLLREQLLVLPTGGEDSPIGQ